MKTSTAVSVLALATSVASSPLAELEDRTFFPPGCSADNKILIIGGLDQQFCSAYLQPTSTVTAVNTVLNTAFATTTATQTVIVTSTSTPVPSLVCGVPGFAAADASTTFFNNDGSFTLEQCQAQCVSLAAGTFASSSTLCACYAGSPNAVVVPAEGSPFTFYDINCPVASTLAKRAPVCAPASAKVPPRFIQLIKASPARISSACTCLLNKQTPAACTIVKSATVIATTTVLEVQTATVTETAVVTAA